VAAEARIDTLDGWRGIAIVLVLWGHFLPVANINLGTFGVEFFFVLSGRLMAQILFVKASPLPEFFYRRAGRIFPALIAYVLIYWAVAGVVGKPYSISLFWVASALTFTLNYVTIAIHSTGWLDHIWSLCVEEHAYMLLGAVVLLLGRSIRTTALVTAALAAAMMADGLTSSLALHQPYETVYHRSDVQAASIFLSVAIYLGVRHLLDPRLVARFAGPVFVVTLVMGVVLSIQTFPITVNNSLATICLAVAVALVDLAPASVARLMSMRPLTQVGIWSYSIYLWQQPFYKFHDDHHDLTLPLLAGAVACGIASYYLIERPARGYLNRQWPRIRRNLVGAPRGDLRRALPPLGKARD
jgi:peptidoglycan/LPS O-acetylase OafA/YrhL